MAFSISKERGQHESFYNAVENIHAGKLAGFKLSLNQTESLHQAQPACVKWVLFEAYICFWLLLTGHFTLLDSLQLCGKTQEKQTH